MCAGVNAPLPQFLLDARVPKILYLIICSSWQLRSNLRPPGKKKKFDRTANISEVIVELEEITRETIKLPVAQDCMELNYQVLLLLRECASLEVGTQIVYPPQPAALAAPLQA